MHPPPPEFSPLPLHAPLPISQQALSRGGGGGERLSAPPTERRLYIAVRGGPGGPAVVRVSTTLAAVDAQVDAVQRTVALAGLGAILAAGALAWLLSREVAQPLVQLGGAARAIADGRPPAVPDSRVPQVARSEERRVGKECRSRWSPDH